MRRFRLTVTAQERILDFLLPDDATTEEISRAGFAAMIRHVKWRWREWLPTDTIDPAKLLSLLPEDEDE